MAMARTATRPHPRPGSPTVHESSVGGPPLWPVDEAQGRRARTSTTPPLPLNTPEEVRALRRTRADGVRTAGDRAALSRISAGHDPSPLPEGPHGGPRPQPRGSPRGPSIPAIRR